MSVGHSFRNRDIITEYRFAPKLGLDRAIPFMKAMYTMQIEKFF